jgi:hypothetical protein
MQAINSSPRPLSLNEIILFIRKNDQRLFKLLLNMCDDYLRIILKNSEKRGIIRYTSNIRIKGMDKRAIYYGREKTAYSAEDWSVVPIIVISRIQIRNFRMGKFPLLPFKHDNIVNKELFEEEQNVN